MRPWWIVLFLVPFLAPPSAQADDTIYRLPIGDPGRKTLHGNRVPGGRNSHNVQPRA